ncbi:hypothetical protein [Bacillus tropicus]|uniref:hypothetical protein n=2 Tax=Bacillus cereus group TaxID=86661 RepID=UPI0030EDC685
MGERQYYAERHNLTGEITDFKDLVNLFVLTYSNLDENNYFAELCGYMDKEKIYHRGLIRDDEEELDYFAYSKTYIEGLLPVYYKYYKNEIELFTVIELLYDYVSLFIPLDELHKTATFNKEKGQAEYRRKINLLLSRYKNPVELNREGYIVEKIGNGLTELIYQKYDDSDINEQIKSATTEFLRYGATLDDKKDALIRLGNIMEPLREEIKAKLSKEDTSDIFNLLNNFQLRHNNVKQKTDYDKEIYYPWMFYQMLAALDAFLKIKERE